MAEVFDLKDGKIVNSIKLNKDLQRQPFTDVKILNATESTLKYILMTNVEINVYEQNKVVETIKNPGKKTFVFVDYDTESNVVVIGSVNDTEKTVDAYPADNSLPPFSFTFDLMNDALLRTWNQILVVKFQTQEQRSMIVAHNPVNREMLFNDLAREVGSDFQVCSVNKC
eukprot:TRINITY_DN4005_c0_g1_i14.p1 TRINITY_DN4005_c0_g1~~TRINITY_DN4005_c0_g1_i14.p1  ORF type:complete len:170 (+),score=45.17 TRINITY_DN4005_c0_g1_i14:514-1023(+)